MSDEQKIEQLETEIIGLKIRMRRLEDFIGSFPVADDYILSRSYEEEDKELLEKAKQVIIQYENASASLLQRRLEIGYSQAANLLAIMEEKGWVGHAEGSKPRAVLISANELENTEE